MSANYTAERIYFSPKSVKYCHVKAMNHSFMDSADVHISNMLSTPGPVEKYADYFSARWPAYSCSASEVLLRQACCSLKVPSVSYPSRCVQGRIPNCTVSSTEPSSYTDAGSAGCDGVGPRCPFSVLNVGSTSFHASCSL